MRDENNEIVYQPISFSSSAYAQGIKDGVYEGWDDPRLYTVQGMRARGYSPEAITQWWKDMGMTRRDIKAPLSSLDALNRDTSTKRAETFESDEVIDPFYDSDCLICARPFGDGFGMWASRIRFDEVETAYYAAVKDAKRDAYTDLMNQRRSLVGRVVDGVGEFLELTEDSWKVFRDEYLSDEERDEIEYTATYTLKSKKNPYGVRKTARTLPYWWLMQIPVTYPDGTEELGYGLDALNAYMSQYLIEGKKESSLAKQVEAYLREILVVPEKIGGQVMDIQEFGLNPPTRRIPAFSPRFLEDFEANGVSADPPPPPRDNTDGSCVICGRDFIFSPLAQSLSVTYAQKSDGGVIDMKSRKTMPEDDSVSRTPVHIAGKYLFTYQGSALDEYIKQNKSPSQKVINLLRLALVPGITANREMFQLLKGLQFQEEAPIQFPSKFIDEFEAETFEDMKIKYDNRDRIFFIKSVDYDTDGEIENDKLPQEFTIKIPSEYHYFDEDADEGDITDVLNEWISTETGFLTKGIVWIEEENNSWLKNAESAESVLASVKSAETIDQAQAVLSNYSGQGMMAENLQYLNSIISYDYGSGKNADFEVYGAPTLQDVQKFAEGLVNIQRFLGE